MPSFVRAFAVAGTHARSLAVIPSGNGFVELDITTLEFRKRTMDAFTNSNFDYSQRFAACVAARTQLALYFFADLRCFCCCVHASALGRFPIRTRCLRLLAATAGTTRFSKASRSSSKRASSSFPVLAALPACTLLILSLAHGAIGTESRRWTTGAVRAARTGL